MHTGFFHRKINCIRNLKTCPNNVFDAKETLHITNKINELSFETNFNLLAIRKLKFRSNHLYLKMTLLLSDDINPGHAK